MFFEQSNSTDAGGERSSRRFGTMVAVAAFGLISLVAPTQAQDMGNWVGTWTTSVQPAWESDFPIGLGMPSSLWNQTIRQVARVSIGGDSVRIIVSNEFGEGPIEVGSAHIALTGEGAGIVDGTDRVLTFGGSSSIVIPAGAPAISDPIDLNIPALSEVSVSLYFPGVAPTTTMHWDGHQTGYIAGGDQAGAADLPDASTLTKRIFLSEILVDAPEGTTAIVMFGDSITDGDGSTVDGNDRWPDLLAARLVNAGGHPIAVQNMGISGAKVLTDRMGTNSAERFERDVLGQADVHSVVVMMGINDIGWPGTGLAYGDPMTTAEAIIAGHKQLVARGHAHGLHMIGATLTPFGGAFGGSVFDGYFTEEKEAMRLAVNDFIRNGGVYDAVIDFDAAVVDPAKPGYIRGDFDKGDHLHPNPAGYIAMADFIDLSLFTGM